MKKIILFITVALAFTVNGYAQTGRQVHGVVQDSTKLTIPGTLVKLISATDSLNSVTDANGVFTFSGVKGTQFSLTFRSLGYEGLKRKYTLDNDTKPADIGVIKLHAESKLLNVVNITDVNAIRVKEDTTEYKASAYPVRANAPVEDVLKKLPGVDVDKDGNVTSEGKAVNKVRVNGKDFFGGDVKTATKNLPADMIESIQMIDDYGDQANLTGVKTGEPNKIMNIVIRQDRNYGYSLSATGGDGGDAVPVSVVNGKSSVKENRYVGSINSFKFKGDQQIALLGSINNTNVNTFSFGGGNNGGGGGGGRRGGGGFTPSNGITLAKSLGLNFRDQWGKNLSVYGSYSFADNTTNTTTISTQTNNSGSATQLFNPSNTDQLSEGLNHRINWNMEYKPDTLNYFKIVPSYSYSSNNGTSNSTNLLIRNNVTNSNYLSNTISNSSSPNYGISTLYNHRFKTRGRNASISADASSSPSNSYQNPFYIYIAGKPNAPLDQRINTSARTNSLGVNLSYIEPLTKLTSLEANYSYNTSYTTTNKETDTVAYLSNNTIATNPAVINKYDLLSNNYNYTFTTNRFGLNYRVIDNKYNLTLGLGVQPAVLDGYSPTTGQSTHVTSFNYIPTIRYVYNFSRSQAFSANYNGYSNQPSFNQLQPVTDFSSATYPVQGNPNLNPEFNNNFSVRFSKFSFGTGDFLLTNLSFTQTDNKISANTTNYPRKYAPNPRLANSILTTYDNTDGYYSANGFFAYSKPWQKRKYTLMFNGGVSYTNNISFISNIDSVSFVKTTQKNTAKTLSVSPGMRFRVDITDIVDVQLSSSYSINKTDNTINDGTLNSNYRTLNLGLNGKNYFWTNWTLSYDYTKTIYEGFVGSTNPNILNAYVERRFLKNNMATIRASAFDIFNENTGFSSNSTAFSTTSTQSNRLGRYFLLTLTVRLQKFAGKSPQQDNGPGGGRRFEGGGGRDGGGGRGPGGF